MCRVFHEYPHHIITCVMTINTTLQKNMILKAVITCAGIGSRLLPFTKELPKEMAPVFWQDNGTVNVKPLIELIFEQMYDESIREYCFITGRTKRTIENHFTPYSASNHNHSMKSFYEKLCNSKIFWVTQYEPKGFGDAVRYASSYVGLDNFILHAGDVSIIPTRKDSPIKKLIEFSTQSDVDAVLLVRKVEDPQRHGIVTLEENEGEIPKVLNAVEKPDNPKSDLGIMPMYLLNPLIFSALEKTQPDKNNEVQLTDAIQKLIEAGKNIRAIRVDDEKFLDVGVPDSYWNALQDSHKYLKNN